MRYIIAGGTGFIGQELIKRWLAAGHQVTVIGRSREKINALFDHKVEAITWLELLDKNGTWLENCNAVINLAGANIGAHRWSPERQQELLQSRIATTQQLAVLCAQLGENSPPLFNANGVGIYGAQQPANAGLLPIAMDEETPFDLHRPPDFLAKIGRTWEIALEPAIAAQVKVVKMRFGVVLAKTGGALPKLSLPFKLFLGGPLGSGQQPFSWIHLEDLCNAIEFLIDNPNTVHIINLVAPDTVTQKQFATVLGKVLQRPSFFSLPAWILKLMYGKMAEELLLSGQNIYPTKLLHLGFKFKYPTLPAALTAIYVPPKGRLKKL